MYLLECMVLLAILNPQYVVTMICAMPTIPMDVIIGRSFHENFLYLSINGTKSSEAMNSPGQSTPVTNLSYWVLRNA